LITAQFKPKKTLCFGIFFIANKESDLNASCSITERNIMSGLLKVHELTFALVTMGKVKVRSIANV
jgi:hypothetical protein